MPDLMEGLPAHRACEAQTPRQAGIRDVTGDAA